jgi:hypothetical protein
MKFSALLDCPCLYPFCHLALLCRYQFGPQRVPVRKARQYPGRPTGKRA